MSHTKPNDSKITRKTKAGKKEIKRINCKTNPDPKTTNPEGKLQPNPGIYCWKPPKNPNFTRMKKK